MTILLARDARFSPLVTELLVHQRDLLKVVIQVRFSEPQSIMIPERDAVIEQRTQVLTESSTDDKAVDLIYSRCSVAQQEVKKMLITHGCGLADAQTVSPRRTVQAA